MPGAEESLAATSTFAPSDESSNGEGNLLPTSLEAACRRKAIELATRLSGNCRMIVRTPYVLAGDLTEHELDRQYRETILPTVRALATSYFDRLPNQPITLLMFSSGRSYRRHAQRFDGRQRANYHGYYQKADRRVVLNISTGNGTLAHELTHALAHFDFPDMPEWFDEGLASLHEESVFSKDGLRLEGVFNWRLNYLLPAIRRNRLQSLDSLIRSRSVRQDSEALDYAHSRYFCLYLQSRQLLSHYYRKFRTNTAQDPTGRQTLCELLRCDSLDEVDRDFRNWALSLRPLKR